MVIITIFFHFFNIIYFFFPFYLVGINLSSFGCPNYCVKILSSKSQISKNFSIPFSTLCHFNCLPVLGDCSNSFFFSHFSNRFLKYFYDNDWFFSHSFLSPKGAKFQSFWIRFEEFIFYPNFNRRFMAIIQNFLFFLIFGIFRLNSEQCNGQIVMRNWNFWPNFGQSLMDNKRRKYLKK